MFLRKNVIAMSLLLSLVLAFAASAANASKPSEYDLIVNHLKSKYRAKKVTIPFMWLARFAVSVVRPAGVKSFSVTLFEDLKFSRETLDKEMQDALKTSFTPEWSSIFRVRSREGQQAYMYMRESGKTVKIALVTIDKNQAAIIRATFSPEKLAEFMNDPKIFGISLGDTEKKADKPVDRPKNEVTSEPIIEQIT
jgi:hypothetical protein